MRLNHDVPPKLEDIINKALEKDREPTLSARLRDANRPATAEARYRNGTSHSCEFRHGGGRTGKRLSGCPTAVASIRFLPCACSISVIERREGRRSSCRGQETLEGSGSRRRSTCRGCNRGSVLLPLAPDHNPSDARRTPSSSPSSPTPPAIRSSTVRCDRGCRRNWSSRRF